MENIPFRAMQVFSDEIVLTFDTSGVDTSTCDRCPLANCDNNPNYCDFQGDGDLSTVALPSNMTPGAMKALLRINACGLEVPNRFDIFPEFTPGTIIIDRENSQI